MIESETQDRQAIDAMLAERARKLALQTTDKTVREVAEEVAVLTVGDGVYGIPVESLESVVRTPTVTRLPGLPPWMPGIVQVRGQLVSAVDGDRWLDAGGEAEGRYLAVLSSPQGQLGLIVDRIIDFRTVYTDELVDSLQEGDSRLDRPVRVVTRDLLNVLDVEALFKAADRVRQAPPSEPRPRGNGTDGGDSSGQAL